MVFVMRVPVLMAAALALGVGAVPALAGPTREQIEADRREMVEDILTEAWPHQVERQRKLCFAGVEPERVAEVRAEGTYFTPDAADSCVATLTRHARDRALLFPYQKLVAIFHGDAAAAANLPRAIGAAAMNGKDSVFVANGKGTKIRPAMAFDAGFVVAYQDRAAVPTGKVAASTLRAVTEACLADKQDIATCYSIGVLYGAQTYREMTARR